MSAPAAALLRWFRASRRDLPWRRRRDAYTTWVSEVMLQQTTVDAVAPRYEEFLRHFPDLPALAAAGEDEVVAAWAGLGYYRRARALHRGVREVVARHGGVVPREAAALEELPGIGAYTAGAIRALAYNLPAAAVDGNVARVLARATLDEGDIATAAVRERLARVALAWLPEGQAGAFAEALIELGALVCRPRDPECGACPIAAHCRAHAEGAVDRLPVKRAPKKAVPVLSLRAVVRRRGSILLVERPAGASLLPGFLELPGRWTAPGDDAAEVLGGALGALGLRRIRIGEALAEARHTITHHRIRSVAHAAEADGEPEGGTFVKEAELDPRRVTTETRKLLRQEVAAS